MEIISAAALVGAAFQRQTYHRLLCFNAGDCEAQGRDRSGHLPPCHHIELLHLTGSQFIAEFLPEACLHATIARLHGWRHRRDSTVLQCCSAARGPSAQMQRQLHVKTLHNKPNPGPGLVTRLQTVTAANFHSCCRPFTANTEWEETRAAFIFVS